MAETAVTALPLYKCHKRVWALQIARVDRNSGVLYFLEDRYPPRVVGEEYVARHDPQPTGYWVRYVDGYESYSPKQAFEDGYTPVTNA